MSSSRYNTGFSLEIRAGANNYLPLHNYNRCILYLSCVPFLKIMIEKSRFIIDDTGISDCKLTYSIVNR